MAAGWYTLQNKMIFLDRDGVINRKAPPHDYIKSVNEFQLLSGAGEAIHLLNAAGYKVVIVTNQRGIARGLMTMKDLNQIHQFMKKELLSFDAHIDDIFVCPHDIGQCHCRKPDIGLFLQAEKNFKINKDKSYMIGDSRTDIEAGKNYGIKTISIDGPDFNADHDSESLLKAVHWIIKEEEK